MTIVSFAVGVGIGAFAMLLLFLYAAWQARRKQPSARPPPNLECEVCGMRMESWDTAKAHAVGGHSAITEETWPDIIREGG